MKSPLADIVSMRFGSFWGYTISGVYRKCLSWKRLFENHFSNLKAIDLFTNIVLSMIFSVFLLGCGLAEVALESLQRKSAISILDFSGKIIEGKSKTINLSLKNEATQQLNFYWRIFEEDIEVSQNSVNFSQMSGSFQVLAGQKTGSFSIETQSGLFQTLKNKYRIEITGDALSKPLFFSFYVFRDLGSSALSITSLPNNGYINIENQHKITLSGSCGYVGELVRVSVRDISISSVCSSQNDWSKELDTTSLKDGKYDVVVEHGVDTDVVSSAILAVTKDTKRPNLTWLLPDENVNAKDSITISGLCEEGINIKYFGQGLLGDITNECVGGIYSQVLFFSAGDGKKNITISQTSPSGNLTKITKSFIRDATPPILTQNLVPSTYYSSKNQVTFGGLCENELPIYVSGAESKNITCIAGQWSFTTHSKTEDGIQNYIFTQTDLAQNVGEITAVWIRDTVAPNLSFTSASDLTTSGNSVTFSGQCESGKAILVSGTDVGSISCTGGVWSYKTLARTEDQVYSYHFKQSDEAGNSSSISGSWTRITIGPKISIEDSDVQITSTNSITIAGKCSGGTSGSNGQIIVEGAETSSAICSSTDASEGTWTFTTSQNLDGVYLYNFIIKDNSAPNQKTSTATLKWTRDATPPVIEASTFKINNTSNGSTPVSYNKVQFKVTDNLSNASDFCISSVALKPSISDECWTSFTHPSININPSNSVILNNYYFNIGIIPQEYQYYLWVKDIAGNISTNTGVEGVDKVTILLTPVSPPSVSTVIVSNNDFMAQQIGERTIPGGSDVFIRWQGSGGDLESTPVKIYFSNDDLNWTLIESVKNGINNCESLKGAGPASVASTGCFKWNRGSPSSNYYRIRVSLSNKWGGTTFANSLPLNSGDMQILAGNTESGLNGSAGSSIFQAFYANSGWVDSQSIVVNSRGVVYFRDINYGIVYVDPSNGLFKQLIPLGASSSRQGDGGSIVNAKLMLPITLGIDGKDNLYLQDYDVIRKIDFSTTPATINTIIGGGSETGATVSPATKLRFVNPPTAYVHTNSKRPLMVLPNGDIYFFSDDNSMYSAKKLRKYSAADGAVTSITIAGNGKDDFGTVFDNFSKCGSSNPLLKFNPNTSVVSDFYMVMQSNSSNTGCTNFVIQPGQQVSSIMKFDLKTGFVDSSQTPASYFTDQSTGVAYMFNIQAMDGNIYSIDKYRAVIRKFDSVTNKWITLVGVGFRGECEDKTLATSCAIDPGGAFVDNKGRLYFVDRGRIRTVNNERVITLYGQSMSYGDDDLPSNGRFGNLTSLQQRSDGKIIVHDVVASRMRLFSREGSLMTIAGNGENGSTSNSTTAAPSLKLGSSMGYANFFLDKNDNLYYNLEGGKINRYLPSSYAHEPDKTMWTFIKDSNGSTVFNGSSAEYVSTSADGMKAGAVSMQNVSSNYVRLLGFNGSSILFYSAQSIGGITKNYIYSELNILNGDYRINMGPGVSSEYCEDGVRINSCSTLRNPRSTSIFNDSAVVAASYDDIDKLWLVLDSDARRVRSFGTGQIQTSATGTIETATLFDFPAENFLFKSFSNTSHKYYYYCGWDDHKIHIRNSTTQQEKVVDWPITSLKCSGTTMVYDESRDSVIFLFKQNGLTGVAEMLNMHPSKYDL